MDQALILTYLILAASSQPIALGDSPGAGSDPMPYASTRRIVNVQEHPLCNEGTPTAVTAQPMSGPWSTPPAACLGELVEMCQPSVSDNGEDACRSWAAQRCESPLQSFVPVELSPPSPFDAFAFLHLHGTSLFDSDDLGEAVVFLVHNSAGWWSTSMYLWCGDNAECRLTGNPMAEVIDTPGGALVAAAATGDLVGEEDREEDGVMMTYHWLRQALLCGAGTEGRPSCVHSITDAGYIEFADREMPPPRIGEALVHEERFPLIMCGDGSFVRLTPESMVGTLQRVTFVCP